MNLKLLILGALAYAIYTRRNAPKASQPAVKAPTQEEINAALMKSAQQTIEQAQNMISSI